MCRELETVHVEDLGADVAVQAHQSQVVGGEDASNRFHGDAARQRESELLVLVRRGDELVRVSLHADGHANQYVGDDATLARQAVEALDLHHRVQHDVTDTGLECRVEFVEALVVAVQRDSLCREARVKGDRELTTGTDVE